MNDGEKIGRYYLELYGVFLAKDDHRFVGAGNQDGIWEGQGRVHLYGPGNMHSIFLFKVLALRKEKLLPGLVPGIGEQEELMFQSIFRIPRIATMFKVPKQGRFNKAIIDACLRGYEKGLHSETFFPLKQIRGPVEAKLDWQRLIGEGIVEVPLIEVVA